jgi:hypothetical protein
MTEPEFAFGCFCLWTNVDCGFRKKWLPEWWNGRHDRFKICCFAACRFESGLGYQHFNYPIGFALAFNSC